VNPTEDQRLRQRLHEELGALEISPPPVLRVTGRGQGIRARRRALAIGGLVVVLAGGALSAHVTGGPAARAPTVTVSAPDPAAAGGVFASGTADGKRWALAVRNVNADPGTQWCLPAVMFNGRYGDVLYPFTQGPQASGHPAYLAHIPGFPGVGAVFTQVKPGVTKVGAVLPGGQPITVHPVRVSGCGGQHFLLAGFAFANAKGAVKDLTAWSHGGVEGLNLASANGLFGPAAPGIWANSDTNRVDIASSWDAMPIGHGTVSAMVWHVRASLGLFGQCYVATLRGGPGGGHGQSADQCVPVAAPPRTYVLSALIVPSAHTQLLGYAGPVNPRTAYLDASVSNGTTQRVVPVRVAGRAYVAIVAPPGCSLTWVSLFDASGHLFGQGKP
jgi:hypothetical protein